MANAVVAEKRCPSCDITKLASQFHRASRTKSGLQVYCIECIKAKKDTPEGRERLRESGRKWYRTKGRYHAHAKRYGLPVEGYAEMYEAQDGLCAICGGEEVRVSKDGLHWLLAVDHDHETDEVRGLLCNSCNTGLGLLGDDIETLRAAIEYLERNK